MPWEDALVAAKILQCDVNNAEKDFTRDAFITITNDITLIHSFY